MGHTLWQVWWWWCPCQCQCQCARTDRVVPCRAFHSSRNRLEVWLDQFKRFDYDAATATMSDAAAKDLGLDLRPFRVRGGESPLRPPWWRYGWNFVYDVHAIAHRLSVGRLWQRCCLRASLHAAGEAEAAPASSLSVRDLTPPQQSALSMLWAVGMANCAWSLADAQLGLLRAWKEFMEVGCVRPESAPAAGASASRPRGLRTAAVMAQELARCLQAQRREGNLVTEAMVEVAQLLASMLYHQLHEIVGCV